MEKAHGQIHQGGAGRLSDRNALPDRQLQLADSVGAEVKPSLALTCAKRFSHFARYQFNPRSAESWDVADKLYRAARMAIDAERSRS